MEASEWLLSDGVLPLCKLEQWLQPKRVSPSAHQHLHLEACAVAVENVSLSALLSAQPFGVSDLVSRMMAISRCVSEVARA